jgi:hypothetical protein
MLLINIHKLNIVLANSIHILALERQVHNVWCVFGLQRQEVLSLAGPEHLCKGAQIDTQSNVAVASEGRESVGSEKHGNERYVRVVHSLQRNARVIAVEVAVLHQVFDSVDHLEWSESANCTF